MPRKCTICTHENLAEINKLIRVPKSLRYIASQYGMSHTSVARHIENCLNLEIAALIAQRRIENAVDAYSELLEQLEFAKKLRIAAQDYLSDENGEIVLIPRDDEILVMYEDLKDKDKRGNPKKKTDTLDILLKRVESGLVEPKRAIIKHVDIRQFALNAISTTDTIVDKFIKIEGLYKKEQDNNNALEQAAIAVKYYLEKHPDADIDKVYETFAVGRGIEREKIESAVQELGGIG